MTPPALVGTADPATTGFDGRAERRLWIFLALALLAIGALVVLDGQANLVLGVVVAGLVLLSYQRVLLAWPTLLGLILVVILFVPIRRYTVSGSLPFELEPYRIVIALVLACWFCALAADPRVRWRSTGLEVPLGALVLAMLFSMVANVERVSAASSLVVKNFTFFLSYLLVIYFVVSIVRSRRDLDRMLVLLVGGGTIIATAALIEWRTGTNFFGWYSQVVPFLNYIDEGVAQVRGTGIRARASAQHPIALSAALVLLLPIAVYLYQRHRKRIWLVSAALLTLGALSTGSRTAMIMLIAVGIGFLCIKPRESVRMIPWLVPLLVVVQVVMPGTLGTMKSILNPSYVIEEQSYDQGATAGRIADIGPALDRWATKPLLGSGFGTTVADPNAPKESEQQILDNQWLGTLLQIGALGALSLLLLFGLVVARLARRARATSGADAWLSAALATSVLAFALGMLTFDAFAFIQVTFFAFVIIGFGAVVLRMPAPAKAGRLHAAVRLPG